MRARLPLFREPNVRVIVFPAPPNAAMADGFIVAIDPNAPAVSSDG